jgi:glycosyltransferase involved in cell wall biosynthesis
VGRYRRPADTGAGWGGGVTSSFSNRAAERFLEDRKPMRTLTVGAAPHSYDGSSYYRVWLPFKHFGDNSHHIVGAISPGGPVFGPNDVDGLDVLMLQRPAGREGARMLERLAGQTKLVYEVDDDMLQVDPSGLPHLYDERFRESVRRCLRLCDMVTTTNQYLADTIRPYNENVVVLPNFVKAGLLNIPRPAKPDPSLVTIGWAGGTSHLVDMVGIQDVLRDVLHANLATELHFMGFDFSPLLVGLRDRCRRSNWQRDVGEYYKRVDFDIAIAPSADIPFNRSKTPIRALEMAALGIPIVASNRLPYSDFVIDGKTGFLVDGDKEWCARLHELVNDADMRAELGAAAREQAAGWTIEDNWPLWEQAYEQAAG